MKNLKIETTNWLTKGIPEEQLKAEKALSVISARIFTKRTKMGLDQKAFAQFMGVSQGMVSKWESGTYNFTITTLVGICEKLNLEFDPQVCEKEFVPQSVEFVKNANSQRNGSDWVDWLPNRNSLLGKGVA